MPRNEYGLQKGAIRKALYAVLPEAYAHASGGGELPTPIRTLLYQARPRMLALLGVPALSKTYMDQFRKDVRAYLDEHSEETKDWDVVFDERGHFTEPHSGVRVPLGTLAVRRHLAGVDAYEPPEIERLYLDDRFEAGPGERYGAIVYIEKEGLDQVLAAGRIAERFDVAIASCKGQSVGAFRQLLDELSRHRDDDVRVLPLIDFDKAGFEIAGALGEDSSVYTYENDVEVIRLGLRLEDVLDPRWHLADRVEPVVYRGDPRPNLIRHGATDEDVDFLVTGKEGGVWIGQRVELNAFTGPQLIEWLGERLEEEGVGKVLPDEETLELAWRRTHFLKRVEEASERLVEEVLALTPPEDFVQQIEERLAERDDHAWDDVVVDLVSEQDDP